MSFLHGVETIETIVGGVTITVIKTAVIGLIGFAPKGPAQTLTLCTSDTNDAQFGSPLTDFTIPQALAAYRKQGNKATVLVINIYDPAVHSLLVTDEPHVIASRKIKTTYNPVNLPAAPIVKNSAGTTTYVLNTDYTIDDYGTITIINNTLAEGVTLKVTYNRFDTSTVTAAQFIGAVSGSNVRTGMKLFANAYTLFGFTAKVINAPGYSSLNAVATEMISYADANRAFCLLQAPLGTTLAVALAGRGVSGAINFYTSSKRAILCYPYVKAYDTATDSNINVPFDQYKAGVIAEVDGSQGFWFSPSNQEIKGILGTEVALSAAINDPNCDVNTLNAAGITTVFNSYGTGFRTWGNRSASYPVNSTIDTFIAVRRTADIVEESIELASLPFMDKPINNAIIDTIVESVNAFFRTLIGKGALIDGEAWFDKSLNSDANLAAGNLVISYKFLPPPPLERLTFQSQIDIALFSKLATS